MKIIGRDDGGADAEATEAPVKRSRSLSILGTSLIAILVALPTSAQMGGGGMGGPMDGMTNGSEDLVIPAGVRGDGKNGAFFVTDVWIKSASKGSVTLAFHAADATTSAPAATATLDLTHLVQHGACP